MNRLILILPFCFLPLAGYSEEQPPQSPPATAIQPEGQVQSDGIDIGAMPDDIAAEIEADEIMAEQIAPPPKQPGPVESALGNTGAMIGSAIDNITPALEQGGGFFMDTAKEAMEKGGEVVDEITPAMEQGAAAMENTAKGVVEKGGEAVEKVAPALQQAGTVAKDVAAEAVEKSGEVADSLMGNTGQTEPAPIVEQPAGPSAR